MVVMLVNFDECPTDPIEALMWLSGVKEQVTKELNTAWQHAYYEARITQRFDTALNLGYHSRKRALAFTRAENELRGRSVHWGDGLSA